jgi:hypothetical protein
MEGVSHIHQLFRFSRHDDDDSSASWHVACGPLEADQRIYRVMYGTSVDYEITIAVEDPVGLSDFHRNVSALLYNPAYDIAFREACHELLLIDPWFAHR